MSDDGLYVDYMDPVAIAKRSPALSRLYKRMSEVSKRERIVMDALGGDYLMRKRSPQL
jgi:hypothetical protein